MKRKAILFLIVAGILLLTLVSINQVISAHTHRYPYWVSRDYVVYNLLRQHQKSLDAIFIGDSRTRYQIDVNLMQQKGWSVFNAGMDGYYYPFWPKMVDLAIQKHPKQIILSLEPIFLRESHLDKNLFIHAQLIDLKYLLPAHYPLSYLTTVFNFALNNVIDFNALRFYLTYRQYNADCRASISHATETVFLCANNAGYIVPNTYPNQTLQNINLLNNELDTKMLSLLQQLIQQIKRKHITPIIILLPTYAEKYTFDLAYLQKLLGVRIINMSNYLINSENRQYWDTHGAHFNYIGRELYTNKIIEALNKG